jgi:hypothetical protein
MKGVLGLLRRLWKAETFSPTAFVLRAIIITVLYCISELLGLREYTTFLSGTSANVNLGWPVASALGLTHLLLYVGFILLAPIFLIAAGLIAAWNRWKGQPDMDGQVGRFE